MSSFKLVFVVLVGCGSPPDPHQGHDAGSTTAPDARAEHGVHVAPEVAATLGIATEPATAGSTELVRRAPATVSWDPLEVTRVTAQPGGQIRTLSLPRPGESVRKGAVVATLYQPEVRATFEELRVAKGLGEPWLGAARSRLGSSGISAGEIDAALASGTTPETYAVRAAAAGVVLERDVAEGSWIVAGGQLGVIGKPDALVVDMVVTGAAPAPGTAVALKDPSTSESWPAQVASQLPTADAAGTEVRLVTDASPPVGRPLVAEWSEPAAPGGVWVPRTALVDTGKRRVVFVAMSPGVYEPRDVTVGAHSDGRVQLLEGVADGESVVIAGTFLLDSESQIGTKVGAGHGAH